VGYRLRVHVNGEERRVFAGGHIEMAPLVLVASCSRSLYGGTKISSLTGKCGVTNTNWTYLLCMRSTVTISMQ
jgi:hypothetical protein